MFARVDTRNAIKLSLILSLCLGAGSSLLFAQQTIERKCQQIPINLDSKQATKAQLAEQVRQQLRPCGLSATDREIQTAAQNSLNLLNKSKDPEKGIIYIDGKKFTICISWGRHKSFCDTH